MSGSNDSRDGSLPPTILSIDRLILSTPTSGSRSEGVEIFNIRSSTSSGGEVGVDSAKMLEEILAAAQVITHYAEFELKHERPGEVTSYYSLPSDDQKAIIHVVETVYQTESRFDKKDATSI